MRYYNYYHICSPDDNCLDEMAGIIKGDPEALTINGLQDSVEKLEKLIPFQKSRKYFLAELRAENLRKIEPVHIPQKATIDDIEEFNIDEQSRKSFGKEIKTGTGRTCFIRENSIKIWDLEISTVR